MERELRGLAGVVVLGTVLTVLDTTIVNVAIPTLGRAFDTSISTIQWVMTGYLLAFASVIPLSGWASGRFGARRVWIGSLLVFLAGSLLAGAAWSIDALIAFRVVQGLGAGMILPVGQTLLARAAGPQRMGRVMSVIGVPILLAPIFGPVIGGAIVGHASWRWIFLINLPVGLVALLAAARVLPAAGPGRGPALDVRGLLLLSPGLALLLFGLSEAGSHGGFRPGTAIAAAAGLALVAGFVRHAIERGPAALVDLSLFRSRGFATAAATNFLLGLALFGSLILLPLYYQTVRHEGPLRTGLLLVPQGLGAALAMPFAGRITDRIGARTVVVTGLLVALAGTVAYTQVGAHTSYAVLAVALLATGVGLGSTIMPSMAVAFRTVSHDAVPHASSAINVIQRVAGAAGTALLAIVLQRTIATDHARTAAALAASFGTTFWVAAGLVVAAVVPALLLPRTGEGGT